MPVRTIFLSRLVGLYCIFVALSMSIRRQATVEAITAMLHDPSMMLVLGVIATAAGLAMVLGHNVWSGGAPVVMVTLAGWSALIKGLLILFLPPELEARFFLNDLHLEQRFYLYMAVTFALGIYLTYEGFTAKSKS